VLHAEVGDTVVLVLRNNAAFSVNAEPGGLQAGNPTPVAPGRTMTYRWGGAAGRRNVVAEPCTSAIGASELPGTRLMQSVRCMCVVSLMDVRT
jgi:hypothetical protein